MPIDRNKFKYNRGLVGSSRAYLRVRLYSAGGGVAQMSASISAQLDSGADHTILPELLARQAGYSVAQLQQVRIQLANGSRAVFPKLPQARVQVENHRIQLVDVLLATSSMPVLLSAHDLLPVTEFGLDTGDLYFD